jgi:isopentenyl diphosphate isomerase/L-lactate dehydrogenase-like FMN-dependent dehydrogenase/rubredoxin
LKYICTFCNIFVLDTEKGEPRAGLEPGTNLEAIPEDWKCPVCSQPKSFLKQIKDDEFSEKKAGYDKLFPIKQESAKEKDLVDYRNIAREKLAGLCAVNKVCDGNPDRLCMGMKYGRAIGFGGAGQGQTFNTNFKALEQYKLKMRVIKPHKEPEFKTKFLGKELVMPVLASSVSGVRISMNDAMPEKDFQYAMIEGAKIFGSIGLSGNTVEEPDHPGIDIIKECDGWGVPVFKPQAQDKLLQLFKRAEQANSMAVGVDLDGFGSTNWALRGKPVFRKSESDLRELVDSTRLPVIFKGIMSLEDAEKVLDSGAKALDVSNHGGRVLDSGQGVADVLPEIADKLKGRITIMADGAIRTGYDVLKLLALGADFALIGRPLARMSLGGGCRAVKLYLEYVRNDLRLAMLMAGCDNLREVNMKILTTGG